MARNCTIVITQITPLILRIYLSKSLLMLKKQEVMSFSSLIHPEILKSGNLKFNIFTLASGTWPGRGWPGPKLRRKSKKHKWSAWPGQATAGRGQTGKARQGKAETFGLQLACTNRSWWGQKLVKLTKKP